MQTVKSLLQKLLFLIQLFLILLYIVFEELIWEQFAKPLFRYLKYLRIFERLEQFLSQQNRYIILLFFLVILVFAELMGILSPIIALQGFILLAIVLYGAKLLLAAFAFWVLNTQKSKLLSFGWFAYLYKKVLSIKEHIESSAMYRSVLVQIKRVKVYIKLKYVNFKHTILNRFWR